MSSRRALVTTICIDPLDIDSSGTEALTLQVGEALPPGTTEPDVQPEKLSPAPFVIQL
jgi:hypothetical protein